MKRTIPLFEIFSDDADIQAVTEVVRRGNYWANGPEVKLFEAKLANSLDRKYALSFNSGTSALHASLLAYGIGPGDEVIVPSFTFISTANVVLLTGAKPVFADISEELYGLSSEDVSEKITKKTRAIIPVHYGGAPCLDINSLAQIAADNNLILIEDAAEGLGSKLDNKRVGCFGDSAMFSFCQNKVVAIGEGGAFVTDNQEVYENMELIRSHGRLEKGVDYFTSYKPMEYIKLGYNYRMPTICAALGITQLNKIDKLIGMRRERANYLSSKLLDIPWIKIPKPPENVHHIYQMYTIEVQENIREKLQEHLKKDGIMTKIYFPPVHHEPIYREKFKFDPGDLPTTEKISNRVLTLPMYPNLSYDNIDYIVDSIRNFNGSN